MDVNNKRVLVVADVSNLFYCIKKKFRNQRLNYQAFLEQALAGRTLHRAIAYGSEMNGEAEQFKKALYHIGFEPKYKEPKIFNSKTKTGEAKVERKADWDVGIAIDVIEMLDAVDVVVFGSADGDLAPCLAHIKSRGKIAEVLACGISWELKNVANSYREITPNLLDNPKSDLLKVEVEDA